MSRFVCDDPLCSRFGKFNIEIGICHGEPLGEPREVYEQIREEIKRLQDQVDALIKEHFIKA